MGGAALHAAVSLGLRGGGGWRLRCPGVTEKVEVVGRGAAAAWRPYLLPAPGHGRAAAAGDQAARVSVPDVHRKQGARKQGHESPPTTTGEAADTWLRPLRGSGYTGARTWSAASRAGALRAAPETPGCPAASPGQQTDRRVAPSSRRLGHQVGSHPPSCPGRRPGPPWAAPPCGRGLSQPHCPFRHPAGPLPRRLAACASSLPAS